MTEGDSVRFFTMSDNKIECHKGYICSRTKLLSEIENGNYWIDIYGRKVILNSFYATSVQRRKIQIHRNRKTPYKGKTPGFVERTTIDNFGYDNLVASNRMICASISLFLKGNLNYYAIKSLCVIDNSIKPTPHFYIVHDKYLEPNHDGNILLEFN